MVQPATPHRPSEGDATGAADPARAEDAALLAAHVAGDPDAFAELVRRHQDRLWAVALRTTGDREEAADALQDALLSAFRRAHQFRGEAAVTTWLHRVVVNACLDRLRRRTARPTVPLPDEAADGMRPADRARLADPVDPLQRRETTLEIERALAALPDDQRAAVVLVDVEGWSVQQAAQILDCPVGTVKSRCFRGRAKLARSLAHLRNPDADTAVSPAVPPVGSAGPDPGPRDSRPGPAPGPTAGGVAPR